MPTVMPESMCRLMSCSANFFACAEYLKLTFSKSMEPSFTSIAGDEMCIRDSIYSGSALPNTNIPGLIGGFAGERVLRAPDDGIFHQLHAIGDLVEAGETVGEVNGKPMVCTISGVLRGILADGTPVFKGMKSGDVDPRAQVENCYTASDKAIAIGGGVLQAILEYTGVLRGVAGRNALEV